MDVDNTYFFQEMKFHEQDIHKALIFNLNFLMFLCVLYPYSLVDPIYTSKNLKGLLLLSPFEPLITSASSLPLLHYEIWSVWWKKTNVPASMIKETK